LQFVLTLAGTLDNRREVIVRSAKEDAWFAVEPFRRIDLIIRGSLLPARRGFQRDRGSRFQSGESADCIVI
jgi:hypothetical protein